MNQSAIMPTSLTFQHSCSSCVGACGNAVDTVKKNADNVYGAMNIAGDISFFGLTMLGGEALTLPMGALASIYLASNVPMLFSGKDKCDSMKEALETKPDIHKSYFEYFRDKSLQPLNPIKHPVEATAAMNLAGGVLMTGMGLAEVWNNPADIGGILLTATGIMELPTRLIEIFSASKAELAARKIEEQQSLQFGQSSHSLLGPNTFISKVRNWMEEHSELIAGTTSIVSSITFIGAGIASANPAIIVSGSLYLASYFVYALFVKKELENQTNEINPCTKKPFAEEHAPQSFVARLESQRAMQQSGPALG